MGLGSVCRGGVCRSLGASPGPDGGSPWVPGRGCCSWWVSHEAGGLLQWVPQVQEGPPELGGFLGGSRRSPTPSGGSRGVFWGCGALGDAVDQSVGPCTPWAACGRGRGGAICSLCPRSVPVPSCRRSHGALCHPFPLPFPAPIATSSTIFQLGFERALRKQNKEQVPPAAAPEPPQRKQHAGKTGKKAPGNDAGAKPGRCRSLEEALKAVSVPRWVPAHASAWGQSTGAGVPGRDSSYHGCCSVRQAGTVQSNALSCFSLITWANFPMGHTGGAASCWRQETERREVARREFLVPFVTHCVWEEPQGSLVVAGTSSLSQWWGSGSHSCSSCASAGSAEPVCLSCMS